MGGGRNWGSEGGVLSLCECPVLIVFFKNMFLFLKHLIFYEHFIWLYLKGFVLQPE